MRRTVVYNAPVAPQQKNYIEEAEAFYDPSKRAQYVLDYVLHEDEEFNPELLTRRQNQVDVAVERRARPIIDPDTGRSHSRVLFITSDPSVLESGSMRHRAFVDFARYTDELHVLVLLERRGSSCTTRVGENMWLYTAHARTWWLLPFAARKVAQRMLVFNNNVRPDLVVSTDPVAAGLAGYLIAGTFERPWQIHVTENIWSERYATAHKGAFWRRLVARFLLRRVKSVRTTTARLKERVSAQFPHISDLRVLPKFFNFAGFLEATPQYDLRERYPDFAFIILTFAPLTADSPLHDTFAALYRTLKNPRIGMIVIGEGPAKALFEQKVELLGLTESVIFVAKPEDLASHLKTASVLVMTDTTHASEEHVLTATAAGLPLVAYETELRADLFENGTSAFLVPEGDITALTKKTQLFMNSPALKKLFSRNAKQIARDRLIEDPDLYHRAYRESIESILTTYAPPAEADAPEAAASAERVTVGGISYPAESARSQEARFRDLLSRKPVKQET